MSQQFTVNYYLIDEDGNYVLTDPSDPTSRIIISTNSISVSSRSRGIGGTQRKLTRMGVHSFNIKKDYNDEWYLFINKHQFIGRYPTQSDAVGVLYGLYTSNDGYDDSFATWIEDSLNTGGSVIDPDTNVLELSDLGLGQDPRLSVLVANFNIGSLLFPAVTLEESGDGTTWTSTGASVSVTGDGTYTFSQSQFNLVDENAYYRVVLQGADGQGTITILGVSNTLIKNDAADLISLSNPRIQSLDGGAVDVGDFANGLVDVSGVAPGVDITTTYDWTRQIPELTGFTVDIIEGGS
jgi:hypothetical protein